MLGLIENQCSQLAREATPPHRKVKGSKAHFAWLLTPIKTPAEKSAGVLRVTYLSMFILLA
ncbi:hypothetical protein ACOMICROBIO_NCLOACGD_03215 [Vibrio sp. B1ASS3]|nr:hypothetical protein ACOMICROBIO_NCLOACGD_03215 [Vibrio sp. B1ASS3]CAE6928402.1 hypothetical protein ACOMICROBIO_NCLOACGD_03215 [Vibrio sp. B1ASS3]